MPQGFPEKRSFLQRPQTTGCHGATCLDKKWGVEGNRLPPPANFPRSLRSLLFHARQGHFLARSRRGVQPACCHRVELIDWVGGGPARTSHGWQQGDSRP